MIVERRVAPFLVHSQEPVLRALERITANQARIVFVVDSHGRLVGALSDGDFRRWVSASAHLDVGVAVGEVAHRAVRALPAGSSPTAIAALFGPGIDHVPLVDRHGHVVAVAINSTDELRLGRHVVARDAPAVLVGEIGINHQGDVGLAKELVDRAVAAGADVVKFQLRDLDALYRQGSGGSDGEDLGPQYTLDLLAKYNLAPEELFEVFDHCAAVGVEVMCTPWDPPSVDALAAYGVAALKVASADLTNHPLLERMAATGLPLVVSTGMSTEAEIRESVAVLRRCGATYALLHCQSTYPAPFKDVNLSYLPRLAELGRCPVGYSGHERGHHVPVAAVALGARIVEKHLTLDRTLEGNDHRVSLLPDEFAEMVRRIREVEESLGTSAPRSVSPGELMNRVNLAKSLVAARRIEPGETIDAAAVTVKSPGRGLQPNALGRLVGRTAARAVEAGDFFFPSDLGADTPHGREFRFRRPWGLPVRYHDLAALTGACTPDFIEFHFSYRDLDLPVDAALAEHVGRLPTTYTTHSPDLFAGDFLLDLASDDPGHRDRSVRELQRVVDTTRRIRAYFPEAEADPLVVASVGGFTADAFVPADRRALRYERVADGLSRIDATGVRLCLQTLPPFPWYLGGQLYCNLFVDPRDTAEFAASTGWRLCLDISHTQLAARYLGIELTEAVALLAAHTAHLHLVDATGVDGEGVQVGEGDVDWPRLAAQLDELLPGVGFIPEIWQGHVDGGAGFWVALERLEAWL